MLGKRAWVCVRFWSVVISQGFESIIPNATQCECGGPVSDYRMTKPLDLRGTLIWARANRANRYNSQMTLFAFGWMVFFFLFYIFRIRISWIWWRCFCYRILYLIHILSSIVLPFNYIVEWLWLYFCYYYNYSRVYIIMYAFVNSCANWIYQFRINI